MSVKRITIEVAYAKPTEQKLIALQVEENSTLEEIIIQSGMISWYPEIDLTTYKIGIFSKEMKLTDRAQEGDRIEIYRPLIIDPKAARRKRANVNSPEKP